MSVTSTPGAPEPVDLGNWRGRVLVPTLVFVALLVAAISSLGAPLLRSTANTFGVSQQAAQWSLTFSLLIGSVTLPLAGRLATGPRRREVLLAIIATMAAGCVLSAVAPDFGVFMAGRGLQGCGLAMVPIAMSIARDHLPSEIGQRAVANLGITTIVGVALGYPAAGVVADSLGLRAAYSIAGGIAVAALVVCVLVIPASHFRASVRIDPIAACSLSVGIAAVIVYLSEGDHLGWNSIAQWGLLCLAILTIGLLVRRDLRSATPLLDLRLMSNRVVLSANVSAFLLGLASYMISILFIRYAQTPDVQGYGFGASGLVAGLLLLPMSVLGFLGNRVVGRVARVIGPHRLLPLGSLLFAVAVLSFAVARSHLWQLFVEMGLVGLAVACSLPVLPRLIVRSTPPASTSSALALNQVLRSIGTAAGSALSAAVLAAATVGRAHYPGYHGYTAAAVTAAAIFVVAAVLAWLLVSRKVFDSAGYVPLPVETATVPPTIAG